MLKHNVVGLHPHPLQVVVQIKKCTGNGLSIAVNRSPKSDRARVTFNLQFQPPGFLDAQGVRCRSATISFEMAFFPATITCNVRRHADMLVKRQSEIFITNRPNKTVNHVKSSSHHKRSQRGGCAPVLLRIDASVGYLKPLIREENSPTVNNVYSKTR